MSSIKTQKPPFDGCTNWRSLPISWFLLAAFLLTNTNMTNSVNAVLLTNRQHRLSLPLRTYEIFRPDKQITISVVKPGRSNGPLGSYNQIYAVAFHALQRQFRLHITPSTNGKVTVFEHRGKSGSSAKADAVPITDIGGAHFTGYVAEQEGHTEVIFTISNGSRSQSDDLSSHWLHLDEFSRVFATIYTADEHYYIEPLHITERECAEHATDDYLCIGANDVYMRNDAGDFKHIIYRASDVQYASVNGESTSNALADDASKHSRNEFCGYLTGPEVSSYDFFSSKSQNSSARMRRSAADSELDRESAELRSYRSGYEPLNKDCPLLLVADYRFYRTIGGNDTSQTVNYLINIIERINILYRRTDFAASKNEHISGMGFSIRGIIVHTTPEDPSAASTSEDGMLRGGDALHYNMPNRRWKVKQLLETFSREPIHKYYCLSHLFTDQIFEDGILGLAYVASKHKVGGICSGADGYVRSNDGKRVYLNTGLSSIRNEYGRQIITRQAELVLAHELAHNWGAQHDPDLPECSPPSRVGGKYVMYTYSVSGLEPNNRYFSPCTRNAIAQVLRERAEKCFVSRFDSFCGNSIVETYGEDSDEGEECDGGLNKQQDKCCNELCKLRPGAQCSDRNDMCCNDCKLVPRMARLICARGNVDTCTADSYCTGTSAECPPARMLADGTTCLNGGKCQNGTCISYCESLNPPQRSCQCDSVQYACLTCCQAIAAPDLNINTECRPAARVMPLPDGTPCMRGYCRNAQCERVVQSATLARWWLIIEQRYPHSLFKRILTDNIVMLIIFLTLAIWLPIAITVGRYDARKRAKLHRSPLYVHPSYSLNNVTNNNNGRSSGNSRPPPLQLNNSSVDDVLEEDERINELNDRRAAYIAADDLAQYEGRVGYESASHKVNFTVGRRRNTEPNKSKPTEIF